MPKIKGEHNQTYEIDSAGKTYDFIKSYRGEVRDAVAISEDGRHNTIIMRGVAESDVEAAPDYYPAILSSGVGVTIRVASNGVVSGSGWGIECRGADASVINEGKISGMGGVYLKGMDSGFINKGDVSSYSGIFLDGRDSGFVNKGTVYGYEYGVLLQRDGSRVVNDKGAFISSADNAVYLNGEDGDALKFVNHGKVSSNAIAVAGDGSNDTVVNDGRIVGNIALDSGNDRIINEGRIAGGIALGNGNDTIDTRGGRIAGAVYGGRDDDTLITDKAGNMLIEYAGQGFDTVKSTVTYTLTAYVEKLVLLGGKNIDGKGTAGNDILVGNSGNNVLFGYEGNDRLDGKAGNDVLRGGLGADTFVFKTGYDRDRIMLFEDGIDKIDVSGWKVIKNFNDLINNHAIDHGDNVWIVAGSDRLIIKDIQKSDLDAGDFIF